MNQVQTKKITDIEEFCKLYKINIPVKQEFDYYIETLKKSNEYKNSLQNTIDVYVDLEKWVKDNGYSSVRAYKNQVMDMLKDFILASETYKTIQESPLPGIKLFSKDHLNTIEDGDKLVSLDFKSANYNVLKSFQKEGIKEFADTWQLFCSSLWPTEIHPALINSKSFRQIVFGNTNPKRLQTYQHIKILELREELKTVLEFTDDDFIFIAHDELVLKVLNASKAFKVAEFIEKRNSIDKMPIRVTPYYTVKIKKNTFVKFVCKLSETQAHSVQTFGFIHTGVARLIFDEVYSTLHGVPGNKFYKYFKKFIISEPIETRDLLYYNDDELCTWIDEDAVKIKKEKLPHYEKPSTVVSVNDSMKDYPYIWSEIEEKLPDLSNEEKRRIVEIFVNTCKSCLNAEVGCTCWRDE